MSVWQKLSITTAGTTLIALSTIGPAAAASLYSVTELPFRPLDINEVGQIVGEQYLWDNGTVTDLRTLPGAGDSAIFATDINNNGLIVGNGLGSNRPNNDTLFYEPYPSSRYFPETQVLISIRRLSNGAAFISDGTTITGLSRPFDCSFCQPTAAVDINDAGRVLSNYYFNDAFSSVRAYLQDSDGTRIQSIFGNRTVATAINNLGQVLGQNSGPGGNFNGLWFIAPNNTLALYGVNNGDCSDNPLRVLGEQLLPTDLNDVSQAVGVGRVGCSGLPVQALLWNIPNSGVSFGTALGTLGGTSGGTLPVGSVATSINNASQVVGYSYTPSNVQHAFLWEDGTMLDLNNLIAPDLGWELSLASEINEQGQIVGTGSLNDQRRGFLLTPISTSVPEPTSALSLLGLGAFGLGLWLKRQQSKN